jgi:hypothetical protein
MTPQVASMTPLVESMTPEMTQAMATRVQLDVRKRAFIIAAHVLV